VTPASLAAAISMNALPRFAKNAGQPAPAEGPLGALLEANAPAFEHFYAEAAELGDAQVFPCSRAMELAGIRAEDLPGYFGAPVGITRFLEEASGAQVWTF